ncbi:wd-40 repeat protein [Stylonychia lemnae]|uniref:Wd-40 repeat protein n=1 Tax=Stylonychia lemnae TaxID=5949 RepID=A0A078B9V3_STYLE|nr:wd-40 repeat protein [Stylonychia lemnae]|eukprot:CDW90047.1 wd-40 repeat protein [Stylonychia lemnae]
MIIIDALAQVRAKFKITTFRTEQIQEDIEQSTKKIIKNIPNSDELKQLLKQRDLYGNDALYYMALYNVYTILDTSATDRILQDFWKSNIDVNGYLWEASTSFRLLVNYDSSKIDYELETLCIFFQYFISQFNSLVHDINEDIKKLENTAESNHAELVDQLGDELHEAGKDIFDAMWVSIVMYAFPIRMIQTFLFAKLTKRNYNPINANFIVELGLTSCVAIWMYYSQKFQDQSLLDNNYGEQLTSEEIFVLNVIEQLEEGKFRFDILLAFHTGLLWLRVILLLKLTRSFGPLIKIVECMLVDIGQFAVIWLVNLVFFSCMGMLLFGEIEVYDQFQDTIIMFIQSALGSWDMTIYDNLLIGPYFGKVYHIIFLVFNMVLLLNLMIAILSTTFSILQEKKLALYYDGIIEAIPQYKFDKTYGSMICAFPPINLIIFPFNLISILTKDKIFLRKLDHLLMNIAYVPVLLIILIFFIAGNAFCLPFSYLYTLYKKFKQIFIDTKNKPVQILRFLEFLLFGLVYLGISQIFDIYVYFKHCYSNNYEKLQPFVRPRISKRSIKALFEITETYLYNGKKFIDMRILMGRLREKIHLNADIAQLIYGPLMKKSNQDSSYETIVGNDNFLKNIQAFNNLKVVIKNCTDEHHQVDLKLINIQLREMQIKMRIIINNLRKEASQQNESQKTISIAQQTQKVLTKNLKGKYSSHIQFIDKSQISQYLITEYQRLKKNISTEFAFVNPRRILDSIRDKYDRDNQQNKQLIFQTSNLIYRAVLQQILKIVTEERELRIAQKRRQIPKSSVTRSNTLQGEISLKQQNRKAKTILDQDQMEQEQSEESFWQDLEVKEENKAGNGDNTLEF